MPNPIPLSLASYISTCLSHTPAHTQALITSTLSTPSPWLTLRFLYTAVHGIEDLPDARRPSETSDVASQVIFASFLRPLSLWTEVGKKLGLDIPSLLKARKIFYVDGLTCGLVPNTGHDPTAPFTTKLKSLVLEDIVLAVKETLNSIIISNASTSIAATRPSFASVRASTTPVGTDGLSSTVTKTIIILDGIDFVLASQPSVSALHLQSFLSTLRTKSQALIITSNADSPLLHNHDGGSATNTPLEVNHAHFITSMAYQSQWVFQLRGLDTGSAKDVSGVIRVSRGGADEDSGDDISDDSRRKEDLVDGEWLYQVKGDGSVRVWGRGE